MTTEDVTFFFDIKKESNQTTYLHNTQLQDEQRREHIVLFEDDLGIFIEALSMLLGRLSQDLKQG
ncbi:hypothetical protein FO440_24195 [Mucilaginibacter corticis]|uniref:DUF3276 family protein n=1 Tax=Mucilaginibacter corticis TaxID=2597670 RepID=A0A556M4V2_9SPHI|nr:hypothetical protein FO440_24195 [Mucilaginibacter corticis]